MTGHRIVRINEAGEIVTDDVKAWLDTRVKALIAESGGGTPTPGGLLITTLKTAGDVPVDEQITNTITESGMYFAEDDSQVLLGGKYLTIYPGYMLNVFKTSTGVLAYNIISWVPPLPEPTVKDIVFTPRLTDRGMEWKVTVNWPTGPFDKYLTATFYRLKNGVRDGGHLFHVYSNAPFPGSFTNNTKGTDIEWEADFYTTTEKIITLSGRGFAYPYGDFPAVTGLAMTSDATNYTFTADAATAPEGRNVTLLVNITTKDGENRGLFGTSDADPNRVVFYKQFLWEPGSYIAHATWIYKDPNSNYSEKGPEQTLAFEHSIGGGDGSVLS